MKKILSIVLTAFTLFTTTVIANEEIGKNFTDVAESHWAYDTINWGVENGILKGYPDGSFKPSDPVTEEEFITIFLRKATEALGSQGDPGGWSDLYYYYAAELKYPVTLDKKSEINRTQVAEIISSAKGVNYTGTDAIKYMLASGLASGKTSATVLGFAGNDKLSRAEAVQFIRNYANKNVLLLPLARPEAPTPTDDIKYIPWSTSKDTPVLVCPVGTAEVDLSSSPVNIIDVLLPIGNSDADINLESMLIPAGSVYLNSDGDSDNMAEKVCLPNIQ